MKVKKEKPAAFHSAMQSRSSKKKEGRVRNSNAGTMLKKRSDSLLVEYRRLRKANRFVDNRVGEQDATLAPEEKALLRFRAQKLRGKKHSKYDLGEDEHGGGLGELGVAIDNDAEGRRDYMGNAEDEENENLLEQLKGELPGRANQKKTKREVMREVISKSKFHRFEKSRQREEDMDEQETLDERFEKLLQGSTFDGAFMSPNEKLLLGITKKGENPSDDVYDGLTKQLASDVTVKATDRTETPEETEAKKKKAAERAKAKRERRMMADSEEDPDIQEEADIPEGGYAARRKRQKLREEAELRENQEEEEDLELDGYGALGDDDIDSDGDEGEEISELEKRRRKAAAGDDPLQAKFRALTESLLTKLNNKGEPDRSKTQGKKEDANPADEGMDNGEVSSDREVMESESEPELSEQSAENSGSDNESQLESEVESQSMDGQKNIKNSDKRGEIPSTDKQASQPEVENGNQANSSGDDPDGVGENGISHENGDLDVDLDVSDDGGGAMGLGDSDLEMDMFSEDEAATREVPSQAEIPAPVVDSGNNEIEGGRCVGVGVEQTVNLRKSDGGEVKGHYPVPETYFEFAAWVEGKSPRDVTNIISKIRVGNHQELYAATKMKLEELYAIVVEHLGNLSEKAPEVPSDHMDGLLSSLYDMAREVPWFAASAARKDLHSLQRQLVEDIQDAGKSGWPSNGAIVRMRLYSILFPVSDRFHPVTSPLAVLVSQYISQCSLEKPRDLAIGLFLSKFAVRMASPAKRYAYEPLALYLMALKEGIPGAGQDMLVVTGNDGKGKKNHTGPLTVERLFNTSRKSKYFRSKAFKTEGMRHALAGIGELASLYQKQICFPEIFSPAASVLEELASVESFCVELQAARKKLSNSLRKAIRSTSRSRRPLVQKFRLEIPQVRQFNPRFEEDFSRVKEFVDDERVLKKKVDRERRGAMKELRKDAVFMSRVRDVEKERLDKERAESEKRFYKELRAFEDDMKSGGQKGMNPHLKTRRRGKKK
ncbi:hypothetical protein BSKO_09252 [Bryopsis sp. KO-2023]|nr:hypothetical protein BSKO_09252 [Bryopsis sp. KO-2023]